MVVVQSVCVSSRQGFLLVLVLAIAGPIPSMEPPISHPVDLSLCLPQSPSGLLRTPAGSVRS